MAENFRIRHNPDRGSYSKRTHVFVMKIDSAFLRLLVAPIEVSYDPETRRLLRYTNLSNIRDSNGENFKDRIDFIDQRHGENSVAQSLPGLRNRERSPLRPAHPLFSLVVQTSSLTTDY